MIALPIANGLYMDRSSPISMQMCKNWYPAIIQTEALSQQVLYGTPGLSQLATAGGVSRINRGSHTKEGIPYFVCGDRLCVLDKTTPLGVDTFDIRDLGEITGSERVSMADNGTQLMIVADGQGWIYDESSNDWTLGASAEDNDWVSVAYLDGVYVAISDTGTNNRVMRSTDNGATWATVAGVTDLTWSCVIAANGRFFIVAQDGGTAQTRSSTDLGLVWTVTQGATPASKAWRSMAWVDDLNGSSGTIVAVANSGSGTFMYSVNLGANWIAGTVTSGIGWTGITYGGDRFVAVNRIGSTAISTDGINFTSTANTFTNGLQAVAYGGGIFVAVGTSTGGEGIVYSNNGVDWNVADYVTTNAWRAIAYGNGVFVAVGAATEVGGTKTVAISYDGRSWEIIEAPADNDWAGITFGERFVVVGESGTGDRVMTSINGGDNLRNILDYDTDFDANGTPEKVRFIDSYFLVTTNGKKFIRSDANNGLSWNALNFGTAEADPDPIKALEIDNNKAFIFGSQTIEPFDNVGGSGFGFQRSGLLFNKGVTSGDAVIKTTEGIAFLGQGQDESPAMWSLTGGSLAKISHPGIENVLNSYSLEDLEACFCMYYSEAGEFFVSFTFPQDTFVYGFAAQKWHERESSGLRWRVNSLTTAYAKLLAGDAIDGRIGEMNLDTYSEYGNHFEAQVASPNFSNQGDRAFYPRIEATMEAGVGDADTPNPTLTFDYSDNGHTFTGARSREIGKKGKYNTRAIWRRNGSAARYRTNRFTYTGMTKRTFIKLEADIEA